MTIRITLVPHTHWDREWYEPFAVFRERLVSMMDTLLRLGDGGYPHFHLDGQTAVIDDYLAVRPERGADVRRLVAAGRLSAGPWVTQMDEFLTSGESHVRNLEMGLARARELGAATEIGYLPDQFGHVGQMPQILRQAGIERAVVWRGVPEGVDRTSFRWVAPDGSAVVAEYLAFGYFLGGDVPALDTPERLAEGLRAKLERIEPFLADDRLLISVGADHTGPPPDLPGLVEAARPLLGDLDVAVGSLADHLRGPPPDDLPEWRGELRSSARAHLLPNVVSARAPQKRERGRVEALLERFAEPLAALVPSFDWPAEELRRAWTLLLWNGAHDSACGCSHDQVARDVDARFAEVRSVAEGIVRGALASLGDQVSPAGVLRFNPSPFEREGVPALGWVVQPDPAPSDPEPVEVAAGADGWIELGHGVAVAFEDEPDVGDLYNFCFAHDDQAPARPAALATSPGAVEAVWDPDLRVRVTVDRMADAGVVRLHGAIENARPDHRVRLLVRLPDVAEGSFAGSPFELVRRPLRSEGGSLEAPSATWPARHAVLAGGVAAYHEGVFEYEVADRGLLITLLRCVGTISRDRLATRPWPAGPDVPTPDAQLLGTTSFSIGLRAGALADDLPAEWERFALPVRSAPARGGGRLPDRGSLLRIGGDAVLSSVRRRQGGVEVRVWNPRADRAATARVGDRTMEIGPARIETVPVPSR